MTELLPTPREKSKKAPRGKGTYAVTFHTTCGSKTGAELYVKKFAPRARKTTFQGSLRLEIVHVSQYEWVVHGYYRHTCKNQNNAMSDARRFHDYTVENINVGDKRHRTEFKIDRVASWAPGDTE